MVAAVLAAWFMMMVGVAERGDKIYLFLASCFCAWVIWLAIAPHRTQDEIDFPDEDLK